MLALLAALVGAVIWLKDSGQADAFARYAIHFERQSLDGLDVGAPVQLRGIKIGRVEDYALTGGPVERVRVVVRLDRRTQVKPDTAAVITRNLVTGIASIALVTAPSGSVALPPGVKDPLPMIAEGQSGLDMIAGRFSQMGDQASVALANLNLLLTPENRSTVIETIRSVRDLSVGVQKRLDSIEKTVVRVGAAADSFGEAAGWLGGTADRLASAAEGAARQFSRAGERLTLATDSASARLDRTFNQADAVLVDARGALERIGSATVRVGDATERIEQQIGRTVQRVETAALQLEDQAGAAVLELRLSMEAANRVLDRLRNPRAALLGPGAAQLGPGEARR